MGTGEAESFFLTSGDYNKVQTTISVFLSFTELRIVLRLTG
jgi:hypothetical protein